MIVITTAGPMATVAFPYDPKATAIVKEMPGRRWDPDERCWWIRAGLVSLTARAFHDAAYRVSVDGQPYTPPANSSSTAPGSPIKALFCTLPEHLRQPTYKALSKVLHPDTGGDCRLMQELNDTWKDIKP